MYFLYFKKYPRKYRTRGADNYHRTKYRTKATFQTFYPSFVSNSDHNAWYSCNVIRDVFLITTTYYPSKAWSSFSWFHFRVYFGSVQPGSLKLIIKSSPSADDAQYERRRKNDHRAHVFFIRRGDPRDFLRAAELNNHSNRKVTRYLYSRIFFGSIYYYRAHRRAKINPLARALLRLWDVM